MGGGLKSSSFIPFGPFIVSFSYQMFIGPQLWPWADDWLPSQVVENTAGDKKWIFQDSFFVS